MSNYNLTISTQLNYGLFYTVTKNLTFLYYWELYMVLMTYWWAQMDDSICNWKTNQILLKTDNS